MKLLSVLIFLLFSSSTFSWDGYDYESGSYVDIESYDHGGRGEGEVEFYDYESSEYRSGYLDMHQGGDGTLYDYETGEYRELDMD
jgi:hypothetical protein